ncbi:MAG: 50S ribosomal protein L10 [Burkholderiales bacterium]
MDRVEKHEFVSTLHRVFQDAAIVIVTHYTGLTVAQLNKLRVNVRGVGGNVKVTKNRLVQRAIEGTPYQLLGPLFNGPTAIAYANDPVAVAKVAVEYAKANTKLVLLGGAVGQQQLDADGVKVLATLPSLDVLRATIIGLIRTPPTRVAGVLQAPAAQLARVLAAYAEKDEAA